MPLAGFHPTIQHWFAERFGEPTEPQRRGWPLIRAGRHALIAAPTGTGKTLAAYLWAIDDLARRGAALPDETRVLYVSPLRALSNDVQKNLQGPLAELTRLDAALPAIRVLVRTGDTPQRARAAMLRKPPHILVTTPESLYLLLTSRGGRRMLATVRTAIVDEIHALVRDKRGAHLALSLERLEALAGPFQRIGLSATQKPLSDVGRFLVGAGRECELVDVGHRRDMDVAVEVPPSPLTTVCSHEQWDEIYARIAELILAHRTTLIFVNTRKLAERLAARLTEVVGEELVTCHHSSLSRERRLDAEDRLKAGRLRALVATASLELGIDIGEVELVIQVGGTRSIATFLQRVGRSGHAVRGTPKGRLFPLTIDELVEAAALLRAAARGELDRTPQPAAPLDILAQQVVAACVEAGDQGWSEDALFAAFTRSWPYRDLSRADFDAVVALHAHGRRGLLHRDGVGRRIMARKRARIAALTGGGAIPDVADYQVLLDPEGTFIGTINEDFAVEANVGDVFQLGNTSWRILKVERGTVRVADAKGQPPTIPFWLGEGPSRTVELSAEVGRVREECGDPQVLQREIGLSPEAARQIAEYLAEGRRVLGTVPTRQRVVLERFFDESGGMQMVLHAPFGGRINRAWGLALRKRFCRGFGFELQAAANEEAIVISLGLQHSFPLEDVFNYLKPASVRKVLTQAVLDQPMFESRWRWNATRALVLERYQKGRPVPPAILRMRAGDLLAASFPAAVACPENLPAGDLPIPMDHPLVRQTIEDCLTEATDAAGLIEVLTALGDGSIERVAVDTPEPSAFARGILNAGPYAFLDDAPLEERRTQAVLARRALDDRHLDDVGALDPAAIERVREEAWPQPESVEEMHDALLWMGFATDAEAGPWLEWLMLLAGQGRAVRRDGRWFAVDGPTEPKQVLLGRLEALGPVAPDDPRIAMNGEEAALLLALEREGAVLRTRLEGRPAWCERRLLARIHRYTLERLRREIEPVSAAEFLRFLACWQHVDEDYRLEGPRGVGEVLRQLAGFEAPVWAWESHVLPRRVRDYRREWLDELTLSGEFAWGRLWGGGKSPIRVTPISFVPREELDSWLALTRPPPVEDLSGPAADVLKALCAGGAMFPQNLQKAANLPPAYVEMGLADLVGHGLVTCDSFASLRQMITPPSRRRRPPRSVGRWSRFRAEVPEADAAEPVARQLLRRTGVVFRKTLLRERIPVPWSALIRVYRRMELRGEIRGGRFVAGFSGEQYALPEAVELLRRLRREGPRASVSVASADPLNFQGILTPDKRVAPTRGRQVMVG
ncbi:MAG: DEAD/DEAH box helicase [Phycisphaerae bacterium]|jgi:ATP-dependent Lhr-like helicase